MDKLIIFTKPPVPGNVKTRLIPGLGPVKAALLQECMISDTVAAAEKLKEKRALEIRCDGDPRGPGHIPVVPQGPGGLGEKMARAFEESIGSGCKRIIIIGGDSPDLPREYIGEGFDYLNEYDAVIGPSRDGGYYLIGFRAKGFDPGFFRGIDWGKNCVYNDTIEAFKRKEASFFRTSRWYDIDRMSDIEDFLERNGSRSPGCLKTLDFLREEF